MNCYTERAHLLALLAHHYEAVGFEPDDAEEGFSRGLALCVRGKWLTWHLSDEDLPLFDHVPFDESFVWDGHTTEEKYAHIRALIEGDC